MNNIISIAIIILVVFNVYASGSTGMAKKAKTNSTKSTKSKPSSTKPTNSSSTKSKPSSAKLAASQNLEKQNFIIKTVQDLTTQVSNAEPIHLISAYTVDANDEISYANQFSSVPRKLQTIDSNEIKGRDFIKTNLVDTNPVSQIVAAPAPAATSTTNEIIGITNAPMYAPVESIDSSVDIFLINQINTTKNNSVSYLDQPIITMNNKANYIKNNTTTELTNPSKSVENVMAFSFGEKPYTEV